MQWRPATKLEVLTAIAEDLDGIDPSLRERLTAHVIDPEPSSIERFGQTENAFIVARQGPFVVFYDDIEEDFGTAEDVWGRLKNPAAYGNLAVALRELERLFAASTVRIEETPATSREAQDCLAEYYRELAARFDTGFDPDKSFASSLGEFAPRRGSFLVLRLAGEPVGCGGLKPISAEAAYLQSANLQAKASRGPRLMAWASCSLQ